VSARGAAAALLACTSALAACTSEPALESEPQVVERTAADRGAEAFASTETSRHPFNRFSCSTCHAVDEAPEGHTLPGALLAGVTRRETFWAGEEIDLLRAVNQCLQTFMLDDEGWTGSEPVAVDMWAFLESISPEGASAEPAPFTVAFEVPLLPAGDATVGEAVFQRACKGCHGTLHQGEGRLVDFAPVLPEDALASHPIGEYTPTEQRQALAEKVRHGPFLGYGGIMPPFSTEVMSDDEIAGLLAFFGL
jgi:thiosulfate dehydrogenase